MVKKDQMQKELETLKRDNKALQKTIVELTAEIMELKKELEAAPNADANSDGPDGRDGQDGRAETEAAARDPKAEGTDDLKGKIGILLGAICQSCADHCPHHMDANACQNCSIYKSVFNAGYKITRPEPAKEV